MEDLKKQHLNMEEKKNLQKLLFSDIDAATTKNNAARQEERKRLVERR